MSCSGLILYGTFIERENIYEDIHSIYEKLNQKFYLTNSDDLLRQLTRSLNRELTKAYNLRDLAEDRVQTLKDIIFSFDNVLRLLDYLRVDLQITFFDIHISDDLGKRNLETHFKHFLQSLLIKDPVTIHSVACEPLLGKDDRGVIYLSNRAAVIYKLEGFKMTICDIGSYDYCICEVKRLK